MRSAASFVAWRAETVGLAAPLLGAVEQLVARVRAFFHEAALMGSRCPRCDGALAMQQEGLCQCKACGHRFDPTVELQRCDSCQGQALLRLKRYECRKCGKEIVSRFLFDGKVFDAEYFKQKMAESRQRNREQGMSVEIPPIEWSPGIEPGAADLGSIPGLLAALDALTRGDRTELTLPPRDQFDLQRYEAHIQAHISSIAITLDQIPPLGEDCRRDRIWRFIAVIFLMHARLVDACQDGQVIMVRKRETNREGPGVPGDPENADRVEGLVG